MGLDTTHNCFHGSYRGFGELRRSLALAAGYSTEIVLGGGGFGIETVMIDWGHLPIGSLEGDWPGMPDDPLIIMIAHSDCDGVIHSEHCAALADRIDELIPLLNSARLEIQRERAKQFADGLRLAAERGEDVEFG